jgi:CheY-like chemotaxis protein
MNGLELYDHLQGVEGGKDIPVVMLSAALPRREIAQWHLIGMHKPVDLFDLLQTIENLIA